MKRQLLTLVILACALVTSACSGKEETTPEKKADEAVPASSHLVKEVKMLNTEGDVIGHAALSETNEGVKIELKAENLQPGTKAIHLHETGKCTTPDFKSAGAHFNPGDKQHGFKNPKGFHAGDLPNIEVTEKGTVNAVITAPNVTLSPGAASLLDEDGSALVIHERADDYKTDPAGDSGNRIVCGEINR